MMHRPQILRVTHFNRVLCFALLFAPMAVAHSQASRAQSEGPAIPVGDKELRGDSAAAVATVNRFHELMASADSTGAAALLASDLVVLESGGYENLAEFRAHHVPADIEFARATKSERRVRAVSVQGDVAWVTSTSTTEGEFHGRAINSAGAELMVLRRERDGWKISAIHWSSRARRG